MADENPRTQPAPPAVDHTPRPEDDTTAPPPAGTAIPSGVAPGADTVVASPEQARRAAELSTATGQVIAGYVIAGELGRGGMGVVCKARDTQLNRFVALKMVLGTGEVEPKELIRFLAEAEAVASIRHPNVVQVYEYGQHAGRPYMALEYCPGGTLTDRLKNPRGGRLKLDPDAAAELVGGIAAGVAAAHEAGIVHRDLKPGNVLFDDKGRPKVADFGVAKRAVSDLTATQAVMGTPRYGSPEQAGGKSKFVGPPADVWALGVILYECLTGTRPFDGESIDEIVNKVLQADFVPPRKVVGTVPRDLDLICRKCLEREPHRRYPTAKELADDLQRFRDGVPVVARPLGPVARFGRWARRRPTAAALWAVLILGAAAITGTSLWFNSRLVAERNEKTQEANRAKANEEKALANLKLASQAVDECYSLVANDPRLKGDQLKPVRGLLYAAALRHYRGFTREVPDDPALLREYARNLDRVSAIIQATGTNVEALATCRELIAVRERLLAQTPDDPAARVDRAFARNRLADLLQRTGERPAAVEEYRAAVAEFLAVADERQDDEARFAGAKAAHSLGLTYREMTRRAEALAMLDQAVALLTALQARRPDDRRYKYELGRTHGTIGFLHHLLTGQPDGGREKANEAYEAARTLGRELMAADPANPDYRTMYSNSTMNLGILYLRLYKNTDRAAELYTESRTIFEQLAADYPFDNYYLESVNNTLANLANVAQIRGRPEEALRLNEEALRIRERMLARNPDDIRIRTHLGTTLSTLAGLHLAAGRLDKAVEFVNRGVGELRTVQAKAPDDYYNQDNLAEALTVLGKVRLAQKDASGAAEAYAEAVAHAGAVNAKLPGLAKYINRLSAAYAGLGQAHRAGGNPAAAAEATRKRLGLGEKNPAELFAAAKDFAACVPLARTDAEKAGYAAEAVDALRKAKAAGFTAVADLKAHPWPPEVSTHPDFAKLVDG